MNENPNAKKKPFSIVSQKSSFLPPFALGCDRRWKREKGVVAVVVVVVVVVVVGISGKEKKKIRQSCCCCCCCCNGGYGKLKRYLFTTS